MAQYIKQGNIFGRIGTGIGKGLAEQGQKEIEHQRLSSGLKELGKKSADLSPTEFLTEAYSTYGITPQMVQSLGEAAKYQRQRNAYGNSSAYEKSDLQNEFKSSPDLTDVKKSNLLDQTLNSNSFNTQKNTIPASGAIDNRQKTPNLGKTEDTPQIVAGNPLNEQNLTKNQWTPQKRNSVISDYINHGFLPEEAKQLAADDESRDLSEPDVHKKRQEEVELAKSKARETLHTYLQKKLQKTGENIYKDVEGTELVNAERGMIRDLIKNPESDIENVANDWSERLHRTSIAKGKLRKLGQTTGWENFLKGNSSEKSLKEYQDIFKRSGNLEEFNNILTQKNTPATFDKEGNIISPEKFGLGMSSQAAASVSYPPNEKIDKYASKWKFNPIPVHMEQRARKAAIEIEDNIGPDDSILSIARKFHDKDPYFDQQAFFDQISEDKDRLGLNERQRLELADRPTNFLPNWGDVIFLPIFRR